MRIGSRAFWTNPLGWQDDEERGLFVSLLHELTQGTSFWDATCERIVGTDDWEICFKYAWPDDYAPALEWCTTVSDPQPPPPPGPGPAPPGFPDDWGASGFFQVDGLDGAACVYEDTYPWGPIDPGIGVWGGWEVVSSPVGFPELRLKWFPVSWAGTDVFWRLDIIWGGDLVASLFDVAPIPSWPFWDVLPPNFPPCSASRMLLFPFTFP